MKDWTKEWFTGRELLNMSGDWDNRITFHDKVCPEKQILITAGPEKSLKSSTAIELALALTCPLQNWYGIEIIVPMKVLYIFFEGEPGELRNKQIRAIAKYPNAHLDNIIFKHFDELSLDELLSERWESEEKEIMESIDIKLARLRCSNVFRKLAKVKVPRGRRRVYRIED